MCLSIEVSVPDCGQERLQLAAEKASSAGLHVEVLRAIRLPWARHTRGRFLVSEAGSCACSLLSDSADWDAETWAMRPEVLEPLARTLKVLAESFSVGMVVEALWAGDSARETVQLSPGELAALARAGRLGTRTRYELL